MTAKMERRLALLKDEQAASIDQSSQIRADYSGIRNYFGYIAVRLISFPIIAFTTQAILNMDDDKGQPNGAFRLCHEIFCVISIIILLHTVLFLKELKVVQSKQQKTLKSRKASIKKHFSTLFQCFKSCWSYCIFFFSVVAALNPYKAINTEAVLDRDDQTKGDTVNWYTVFPNFFLVVVVFIALKIIQRGREASNGMMMVSFMIQLLLHLLLWVSFSYVTSQHMKHLVIGVYSLLHEFGTYVTLLISIMVIGLNVEIGYESFVINTLTAVINISEFIADFFADLLMDSYLKEEKFSDASFNRVTGLSAIYTAVTMAIAGVMLYLTLWRSNKPKSSRSNLQSPGLNATSNRLLTENFQTSDFQAIAK